MKARMDLLLGVGRLFDFSNEGNRTNASPAKEYVKAATIHEFEIPPEGIDLSNERGGGTA